MLPLWIIDLRAKSERRDIFQSLLAKIDHVCISEEHGSSDSEPGSGLPLPACGDSMARYDRPSFAAEYSGHSLDDTMDPEQVEIADRHEADKNSIITGDYWRYSRMQDLFYGLYIGNEGRNLRQFYDMQHIRKDTEQTPTAEGTAERLYAFQSDLVVEGQKFIHQLRRSNAHPDAKINVVVLGDLTEEFTRIVFPAIAGLLQKEKERILPHHIHQGMEVIGMLFVPSDINTREVSIRRSMLRTLTEIDVQHCVNDIRGYDHMMIYQDVQNRTECQYPLLNDRQLAQYLLQCIVNLYLACDDSHPLLSGTSSADVFYFSMGASSVCFDTATEDAKCRHRIAVELIRNFKSEGDDEKLGQKLDIISADEYNPGSFFSFDELSKLNCDDIDEDTPSPHPVRNFMAKYLKRYYYNLYIRFFTRNLMQRVINRIDRCTRDSLEALSAKSKDRFAFAQQSIHGKIDEIIGKINANDGGIPRIIRAFKDVQEQLSAKKEYIRFILEQNFWREIESKHIPKNSLDSFTNYHDAYTVDIKEKNGGARQLEMKKQAVTELNGCLSGEATILSRLCRSALLGIMCALALVPVLNLISPDIIDLGNVRRNGGWWAMSLFFIPAVCQLISYLRYNRTKKRAVTNLKAMYLHDAYSRVSNRIESEIKSFYDKVIALSGKYIERCDIIRKELGKDIPPCDESSSLFPQGLFNQPLIGGKFGSDCLLPEKEADDAEIRINYIRYRLSELDKSGYFLFINQNKDIVKLLFDDVYLCENLIRRINDSGEEELVTKEQQEKELEAGWSEHKDLFYQNLNRAIKDALLPRENPTVGEKLYHYCIKNPDKIGVMKPAIAYAATNGEVTSSADMEFTDVKLNDCRVSSAILPYISASFVNPQCDKYNKVYRTHIFITRWRCFDKFNFNRILPTEDFDHKIRRERVYEEEIKAMMECDNFSPVIEAGRSDEHTPGRNYSPKPSSLLLWALCPDDSSPEWFRLFDSEFFSEAYADKITFRRILNQND